MKHLKIIFLMVILGFCSALPAQQAGSGFAIQNQAAQPLPAATPQLERLPRPGTARPAVAETRVRIKDVTSIAGHRTHRLTGHGLVTGLAGTGSNDLVTQQFARNMFQNFGLRLDGAALATKNMAVVQVSAEVPAMLKQGEKFDVIVSLLGDAKSLYNGQLGTTELRGLDGQVYAIAGGPIIMGGFSAQGDAGGVQKNHVTIGSASAQLEVDLCNEPAFPGFSYQLLLKNKDNATAFRIASEINMLVPGAARAINAGTVDVSFPRQFLESKIDFVVLVGGLTVKPDIPARVVINQKTGTLVVGHNVRLSKVMFANSNLVITTTETPLVSQPAPFSDGQTTVVPRTQIEAREINSRYNILNSNPTVGDLATALNGLGVTPQDLISIFHSLKAEGSLQAELIVQ